MPVLDRRRRDDAIDVGALLTTVVLCGMVLADQEGVIRVVSATIFVLFVPGRAVVTNWHNVMDDHRIALSIVFSLTIVVLSTTIILWLHLWDPIVLLYAGSGLALVALVVGIVRRHRDSSTHAAKVR